jgi:haloalkane dehalogenase
MTIDITKFRQAYPFKSNYLNRHGLKYHYVDEGHGQPMVMLHGNPTWSYYYRHLIKGFSSTHRTIVPDHMGCGLSDKPDNIRYGYRLADRVDDLDALLTHLKLKSPMHLIVHDWGGAIGCAYATRHPDRIASLIVMNSAAFFHPQGRRLPWQLWFFRHLSAFAQPAILGFNLFVRGSLWLNSCKPLNRTTKAGLAAPYNSPRNRLATLKFVEDIPQKPSDPSFAMVKGIENRLSLLAAKPILICWGMHDFVFTAAFLEEWQRRFPQAQVIRFDEAGHYVLEDVPDRIAAHLRQFLDTQTRNATK